MYSPSLSTYRFIRVLHCSKQCYSSSAPGPFSSCAGFTSISLTDGKWVLFSTLFTLGYRKKSQGAKCADVVDVEVLVCFIGKRLLGRKGIVSWCLVLMQNPYVVLPEIRPLLPQNLSHCLSVNIHHVCNHSHTQTSNFANNFTDFLNVLVGFRSRRVTWMLIIFQLLPTLTKSFVPHKHT